MNIKPPSWLRSSLLSVALLLTIGAGCASAAITVDARATGLQTAAVGANGSGASLTWTHTIGAISTKGLLIVVVAQDRAAATSSVVWDSGGTNVAMTLKGTISTANPRVEIWFLKNPSPQGAKSIKATFTGACDATAGSISLDGVDQTTTFNAASPQTATGASGSNPSLAITSAAGEWIVNGTVQDLGSAGSAPTKGASQNYIYAAAATVSSTIESGGSDQSSAGASVTATWTIAASKGAWAQVGVSIIPDAGGGSTPCTHGMLGVFACHEATR